MMKSIATLVTAVGIVGFSSAAFAQNTGWGNRYDPASGAKGGTGTPYTYGYSYQPATPMMQGRVTYGTRTINGRMDSWTSPSVEGGWSYDSYDMR